MTTGDAVAFTGPTHAGKSTTAYGVGRREGWRPICDDTLAFSVNRTAGSGGVDCVVCGDIVGPFPLRASTYMGTPCDHLFHATCLRPWIEHNLQCPTCRLALPAP